jgi:hypothetical protein
MIIIIVIVVITVRWSTRLHPHTHIWVWALDHFAGYLVDVVVVVVISMNIIFTFGYPGTVNYHK